MSFYDEVLHRMEKAVSDRVWDEIEELAPGLRGTPRDGVWFYVETEDEAGTNP